MRKLTVVLCVVALMLGIMATAYAAKSIDKPTIIDAEEKETEPSWWYEVRDVNPDAYKVEVLKDIVGSVNEAMAINEEDAEEAMTVRKAVEALQGTLPAGTSLDENGILTISKDGEEDTVIDLNEYDFVTEFKDIVYTDGKEVLYSAKDGSNLTPDHAIQVDALKGADDLSGYLLMVVQPETGEVNFVDMTKVSNFDSLSGKMKVKFPTLGAFALIQK